jgi:pimeloyl-ACP methyl ester carboxylesterase
MRRMMIGLALAALVCAGQVPAQSLPAAIGHDAAPDKANPAVMLAEAIPSHGDNLNAVFYAAAGAGPHPTVLLLHGLPGNEQNLDLAQAIRRDGWNVLTLHYRGSWGTPGAFSFAHCIEDAASALAWLRDPASPIAGRVDAKRIVVIGHSMGGFVAGWTGGHDADVMATATISAANIGPGIGGQPRSVAVKVVDDNIGTTAGMHTLAGTSPETLADEAIAGAKTLDFTLGAATLAPRPLLLVTSDDGLADDSAGLARAVRKAGGTRVSEVHLATDHSYSDKRIALEAVILSWLETLPGAPPPG